MRYVFYFLSFFFIIGLSAQSSSAASAGSSASSPKTHDDPPPEIDTNNPAGPPARGKQIYGTLHKKRSKEEGGEQVDSKSSSTDSYKKKHTSKSGTVKKIDSAKQVIVVAVTPSEDAEFSLTEETSVVKNGSKRTLGDLKPGDRVRVAYKVSGGKRVAGKISQVETKQENQ